MSIEVEMTSEDNFLDRVKDVFSFFFFFYNFNKLIAHVNLKSCLKSSNSSLTDKS